jgi:SPFH domain / Band 7 family
VKAILAVAVLVACIASLCSLTTCTYVKQGEKSFFYNVSSGKAVNPQDNPLLTMGFHAAWGINQRVFTVQGTIMDYAFTGAGGGSSPQFDETLRWNSSEGVVMSVEYKLFGQVTDPWTFYVHFGTPEHDYRTAPHKDIRLYEALRHSGKAMNQHVNEMAATMDAETIRTRPDLLKQELLNWVRPYMKQFGFEVTDLLFIGNFKYPDGNLIDQARHQLTDLDAEIRAKEQEKENKANQAKIDVSQAAINASMKIEASKRLASATIAESTALAAALKSSIDEIGVDGTMKLKMTELYGDLTKSGVVPTIIVTEDSIFAAPFYPSATPSVRRPEPANPAVPVNKQ